MKKIFLAVILFIIFVGAYCNTPLQAEEAKKFDFDEIKVKCDSFQMDDKKKELTMKNCTITGKDIVVSAPFAKYKLKDQTGTFTGGVRAVNKDTVITSERMQLLYVQKEVILEGNAVLTTIRTDEKNTKGKYILKCAKFDYFWEKEEGTATGNVHIIQNEGQAFCDLVYYTKKSSLAHMIGNVRFLKKTGDWVTCQEAWIDLAKETFLADKDVEGRFYIQKSKQDTKPQGTTAPQLKEIEIKPTPVTVP